jgi:hypothetical protein
MDLSLFYVSGVLGGNYDSGDLFWRCVLIPHGDLRLAVRSQPRELPLSPVFGQAASQTMSQQYRKRH